MSIAHPRERQLRVTWFGISSIAAEKAHGVMGIRLVDVVGIAVERAALLDTGACNGRDRSVTCPADGGVR